MITENDLLKQLMNRVNMPTCRNLALSITRYLTQQQITNLCDAFKDNKCSNFWIQLLRTMRFINSYINASDRSLYFTFYDQEQYKKIEIQHIAAISQTHSQAFLAHQRQFQSTMMLIKQKMPLIEGEFEALKTTLLNPDLPMPKLKRQTQGMFCTSPFQLFLVCSTFQDYDEQDLYTCFEEIKEFFSIEKEEKYLKQYMTIMKDKSTNISALKKIKQVRYTPYQITANNIEDFMLEDNELHNIIVGLFALTDIMVKTTRDYIQLITDPLHRLVQLTLRYNIYRNYVLAIEEYMPFLFKMYENIYNQAIQQRNKMPSYKFWRPALSKWYLHMNQLHKESEQVYMFCLTKLRNLKLKSEIEEKFSQDQQLLVKLLEALEQSQFQYELGCKTFQGQSINLSEVGTFFDQHPQNYQIVVMEFNEYLVDISVNQQTVHWCGHTDHQMQQPYLDYEQQVLALTANFFSKITNQNNGLTKENIASIAQIDLNLLSTLQIKNRTLHKMALVIKKNYELQEQFTIFGDLEEADKKLEYFNHKALILAIVDQNSRPFYSIPPHFSPEKIIDMLETNDSSNNNSQCEQIQYLSDGQSKDVSSITDKKSNLKKSFVKYDSEEEQDMPTQKIHKKTLSKREPKSNKIFLQEEEEDQLNTSAQISKPEKEIKF